LITVETGLEDERAANTEAAQGYQRAKKQKKKKKTKRWGTISTFQEESPLAHLKDAEHELRIAFKVKRVACCTCYQGSLYASLLESRQSVGRGGGKAERREKWGAHGGASDEELRPRKECLGRPRFSWRPG